MANFDVAGVEKDGRGRDLLDDESTDSITLSKRQEFVRFFEADLYGSALRDGMPSGTNDGQIGQFEPVVTFDFFGLERRQRGFRLRRSRDRIGLGLELGLELSRGNGGRVFGDVWLITGRISGARG